MTFQTMIIHLPTRMEYSSANIPIVQINLDIFVQMMIELYKSKYNKTERKCCVHKNDMTNNKNE